MLAINLLPESLRAKKKNFEFPIFPILSSVLMILFLFYGFLLFKIASEKKIIRDVEEDLKLVQAKSTEAGDWKQSILQMNQILEQVLFKSILPKYSLTLILDKMNQIIPAGMWLSQIHFYTEEGKDFLKIEGFVKPIESETMITDIGNFNNGLKEFIEDQKIKIPAYYTLGFLAAGVPGVNPEVDFSLTTKRRKANNLEITEFSTLFSL